MAQSKANGEERASKRLEVKSHRVNATLAVILAHKTMGCLVPLKDFSQTGAGVYSKFKVDKDVRVRLSLEGMNNLPPIEGRVVWCASSAFEPGVSSTYPFRLGIEFTPRSDQDREIQFALFAYIAKLIGEAA